MQFESKLIPVLREGIDIIKMIFFKKLKIYLSQKYAYREQSYINKLSGAIINDLFGTSNTEEPFAAFTKENKAFIEEEMKNIAIVFEEMRTLLTDALRVQFLCDNQEGIDSSSILVRAKELDILLVDQEIPFPGNFMNSVRKLGVEFNLLNKVDIDPT